MKVHVYRPYEDFVSMYEGVIKPANPNDPTEYHCTVLENSTSDGAVYVEFMLDDFEWGSVLDSWMRNGRWGSHDMGWLLGNVFYPEGANMPFNAFLSYRVLIPYQEISSIVNVQTGKEEVFNPVL